MRNHILHNTIADCDIGIKIVESKFNVIQSNAFYYYGIYYPSIGINLMSSNENMIVGNLFRDKWWGALRIDLSHNNTIYHNDFLSTQVYLVNPCTNFWDNGYPSGGNYWVDFNGTDLYGGSFQNVTGGDNIGDTPYFIDGENRDNYPLMRVYNFVWDLTEDGYVGIDDIVAVASHFGQNRYHPEWNSIFDVNRDYYISIADIVEVAEHFGESV